MAIPRTTHQWLKPLYDVLDGHRPLTLGASGVGIILAGNVGLFGTTGIARIATGGLSVIAASGLGASGFQSTGLGSSGLYTHLAQAAWNGGSGAAYTANDIVAQLKNLNILPR